MYSLIVALVYAGVLAIMGTEEAEVLQKATKALFYLYIAGSIPNLLLSLVLSAILTLGGREIGDKYDRKNLGTLGGAVLGVGTFLWIVLRRTALIGGAYLLMQGQYLGVVLIVVEILLGWYTKSTTDSS